MKQTYRIDNSNDGFLNLLAAVTLLVTGVLAPVTIASGSDASRAKRVLMLFSESKFLPGDTLAEQAARNVLEQGGHSMEFYAEYLDAGRFPDEKHYRLFREYLREKYGQRPPDLAKMKTWKAPKAEPVKH